MWVVYVNDGKSDEILIDYSIHEVSLDHYFEFLRKICAWNVVKNPRGTVDESDREPFYLENLKITRIGFWSGYEIIDITNKNINHKAIALIDKYKNIYILYAQFENSTSGVEDLPKVINIQGNELLSYVSRVPGTGNQFIELYFKYDNRKGKPVLLDFSEIYSEISKIIPKGYGVLKGGGLDLKNMQYSHSVWRPKDANCCPTGGSINLKLSLKDYKIIIIQSYYNPDTTE